MLEIRPLLPDQWPLLKAVRLRALADAPEAFCTTLAEALARSDTQWQENAQRFASLPPAASYIAFFNGSSCGMAGCFVSPEDAHVAELTAFWVAPEHRGKGVGQALVASAVDWASTQGVTTLQAWVVEDNHRAIGFYRKVGFQITNQHQPHTPDPKKQIILLVRTLGVQNQSPRLAYRKHKSRTK